MRCSICRFSSPRQYAPAVDSSLKCFTDPCSARAGRGTGRGTGRCGRRDDLVVAELLEALELERVVGEQLRASPCRRPRRSNGSSAAATSAISCSIRSSSSGVNGGRPRSRSRSRPRWPGRSRCRPPDGAGAPPSPARAPRSAAAASSAVPPGELYDLPVGEGESDSCSLLMVFCVVCVGGRGKVVKRRDNVHHGNGKGHVHVFTLQAHGHVHGHGERGHHVREGDALSAIPELPASGEAIVIRDVDGKGSGTRT
jgi:hypothetical protein